MCDDSATSAAFETPIAEEFCAISVTIWALNCRQYAADYQSRRIPYVFICRLAKRPVYVPNAVFTTASVENPSRMTHRRINETIGLRYRDIGQMENITREVREMLASHPEIDEGQTLMVHLDAFNQSSVDFFIYCMTHTVNWQHYHEIKQDVLLRISRIVEDHGAAIAFPTRTIEVESVPEFAGLDSTREKT